MRNKEPKAKKPPVWSFPATPKASVAIRELQKVKEQQAILAKKSALLNEIIVKEGGGAAHGVRAAIRHQAASSKYRLVTVKERRFVTFLEMPK